jgi:hypothetical protein
MSTALTASTIADGIESALVSNDLSKLTAGQRVQYVHAYCRSVGLNPLTQPRKYITLSGKLTLYATKDCTDQLRALHEVSVIELSPQRLEDIYVVTCKVTNAKGRTDCATGAVPIATLKGEALANALMKCETKAKRRATLSICGLGLLDESEIDTIPAVTEPDVVTPPAKPSSHKLITAPQRKALIDAAHAHGWTDEQLKAYLAEWGWNSTKEIPEAVYDELIAALEKGRTVDEGTEGG